ncbi:GAF domain-containing sensor histidine kinase [Roseateles sp. BYS87W]|uniref:histidine kinase n=1 Tax=Pelomonas baiyunensis TaxID=3299026 RepID=A0ABW7GYM7_9BURK
MDNLAHVAMLTVRPVSGLPIVQAASGRAEVLGLPTAALAGRPLVALCPADDPPHSGAALEAAVHALRPGQTQRLLWPLTGRDARPRLHELMLHRSLAVDDPVTLCLVDLTQLSFTKALSEGENELLQLVASGEPLQGVLNRLTELIEAQFDGLYCSVMLLDTDSLRMHPGAGPRMPAEYLQLLDGLAIGPGVGSCGTAMFHDRTVIVEDIDSDPLWAPYKHLVPLGFKACWSEPIHAAGQGVIGSFAMYYREQRSPGHDELTALRVASHLAGIAIDQARREEERRRAAEWLETQVQARTRELLQAQEELISSRKLAALGQLLAGIAHEMNTPLSNALLSADVVRERSRVVQDKLASHCALRRQELADWMTQASHAALLVEQNVQRALQLITRFKQLTEDGGRAVRLPFRLREAALQAWARVQARMSVRHVQFICDVPDTLVLDGYRDVLMQVLEQLFENACVHGFEGSAGQIRVGTTPAALGHLGLEVRDNGNGMDSPQLSRAFEPFFTTRFGQGGSGLGLFVVHSLVENLLGGAIRLESQPGQGTVARLDLPVPVAETEPQAA